MIISADVETRGLNCKEFIIGCLYISKRRQEYFYNKEDMWKRILELGEQEAKNKKVLNIYCHNAIYDFYSFANLKDNNILYTSSRPFIAKYIVKGKTQIKFLDSLGIFHVSLEKLGNLINIPKMELAREFKEGKNLTKKRIEEEKPYLKRDCEIVYESIKMLKQKIKKEGVRLKGLYTSSQMAIGYFLNKLRDVENWEDFFEDEHKIKLHKTKNRKHIHEAYRGGRVEAFQTGGFENISYIDINSLYPYASTKIDMPSLNSEEFIYNPLRNDTLKETIEGIGICRAIVLNESNEYGLMPIRTNIGNYYPRKGKYLIGTWTNMELRECLKEGYKIVDIEWVLKYKETENPFIKITNNLYELRMNETDKFNKDFYKNMMNRSYGKLGQHRNGIEMIIDNVEEAKKYTQENWKSIKGIGESDYLYQREVIGERKNYYAPIIPVLINAWSRIYLYKQLKKFKLNNLLYTDTDSVIFKGEIPKEIKIGNRMGEFKIESLKQNGLIYARKTYRIGNDIKISGYSKRDITPEDFDKGYVESLKMCTLKSTKDLDKVGTFKKEKRNLHKGNIKHREVYLELEKEKIYKDVTLTNINFFMETIEKVLRGIPLGK